MSPTPESERRPKLLFHVQHMLGIGHRVRAERIAYACAAVGFEVTLLEGGIPGQVSEATSPHVARLHLPPAKWNDASFSNILDAETGEVIDDAWRERRKSAALEILEELKPDVLLIEGFPFARRAFRFEAIPLVTRARELGARTAVSIRDILVTRPDRLKTAKIAETARALFDAVLVHGDPGFAQLADSFQAAPVLADRLCYTGIVSPEAAPAVEACRGDIVISTGGGAVGGALVSAAIQAYPLSALQDRTWRILIGPNLPEADRAILSTASADPSNKIIAEAARSDFTAVLAAASLSISQAGYNTVADLAVSGCPAVLVPFEGPSGKETEQPTRARLMEAAGRAVSVPEPDLSPETLVAAIEKAIALPRATETPYRIQGAENSAKILWELAA